MTKKKQLSCPLCGFKRLIDAEAGNQSELVLEIQIKDGWHPDYFQKCPQCKNQIGIRKIGWCTCTEYNANVTYEPEK